MKLHSKYGQATLCAYYLNSDYTCHKHIHVCEGVWSERLELRKKIRKKNYRTGIEGEIECKFSIWGNFSLRVFLGLGLGLREWGEKLRGTEGIKRLRGIELLL